jgi:hypothetical protein
VLINSMLDPGLPFDGLNEDVLYGEGLGPNFGLTFEMSCVRDGS